MKANTTSSIVQQGEVEIEGRDLVWMLNQTQPFTVPETAQIQLASETGTISIQEMPALKLTWVTIEDDLDDKSLRNRLEQIPPPDLDIPITARALAVVTDTLRRDAEYAAAWHDNIAVAITDTGVNRALANFAASRVMQTLFGVVTCAPEDRP